MGHNIKVIVYISLEYKLSFEVKLNDNKLNTYNTILFVFFIDESTNNYLITHTRVEELRFELRSRRLN